MEISFNPKVITRLIHRYHVVLFSIVILGGVAFMVLSLNNIIISSSETATDYTPAGTTFSFDQATIDQIDSLKSRDQNSANLDLSSGRSNPFVE
jgi:hypothetical protein